MSQSNPPYNVKSPKGTARSQREQHNNQPDPSSAETVEPACRARKSGRGIERREWREMPYDSRTRTFYQPCEWCYPDDEPDESDVETVIRSCRDPTKYHRLRDDPESDEAPSNGPPDATNIQDTGDPIESVTDLRIGQRVIWESREYPLRVVETATESDGTIALRGHNGGEYQLEGRPKHAQPYYISYYGYRSVIRVESRAERAE